MHHFILLQIDSNLRARIKINIPPEKLKEQYDNNVEQEMVGFTHEILVKLFKHVAQIDRIITPGDFVSALDGQSVAIGCSVKVSEGFLYPLKSSLVFI